MWIFKSLRSKFISLVILFKRSRALSQLTIDFVASKCKLCLTQTLFNPLTSWSYQHLISPYRNVAQTNMQVMRKRERSIDSQGLKFLVKQIFFTSIIRNARKAVRRINRLILGFNPFIPEYNIYGVFVRCSCNFCVCGRINPIRA